jgi:hypothetical protein
VCGRLRSAPNRRETAPRPAEPPRNRAPPRRTAAKPRPAPPARPRKRASRAREWRRTCARTTAGAPSLTFRWSAAASAAPRRAQARRPAPRSQTVQVADCQTVQVADCQTVQVAHCQTFQVADCQTVQVADCQTVQVADCQTVQVADCQTVQVADCPAADAVNRTAQHFGTVRCGAGRGGAGRGGAGWGGPLEPFFGGTVRSRSERAPAARLALGSLAPPPPPVLIGHATSLPPY